MSREEARAKLLTFLETIRRPEATLDGIDESQSLVAAGLIDSLALLEIVSFLEAEFAIDLARAGVDPTRLSTIPGILNLIDQHAG